MLNYRFAFYTLISLMFTAGLTSCNGPVLIKDNAKYFLFEDSSLIISPETAWRLFQDQKFEEQQSHSFNPGFTGSRYWLVVNTNTDVPESPQLEIGTPQVNKIEFYDIENNVPVKKYTTGDHHRYHTRPVPSTNFIFPLESPDHYYLVKIEKLNEALQLTFVTNASSFFQNKAIESALFFGILSGIIILMLIFGFYLAIISKEKVYFFYILYVATGWLYVISNTGYGYKYLWPDFPFLAERARPIFTLLTLGFSLHFIEYYTGKAVYPWLTKSMRVLAYFSYFLALLALVPALELRPSSTGYYFQAAIPLLVGLYLTFLLTTLIQKIINGNRMAMFYLLSIAPIAMFSTLQVIYYSGGVDFSGSFLQHYGQATGYVMEAVILTFGLAYRFNSYRREKEQLLINLNQQQAKYAKAIITTQEAERRQLADQLHDVAGSLLSAAKLNLSSIREKNYLTDADARAKLIQAEDAVTDISEMLRNLSHAISAVMLDKVGIKQAVEKIGIIFKTSGKLNVEIDVLGFDREQPELHEKYSVLYGILYELINNIAKHAHASHALVQLIEHEDSIVMVVEDNGVGLDKNIPETSSTHGLAAMKSKIHYLNGTIVFDNAVQGGLIVTIEIPKINDDKNYLGG